MRAQVRIARGFSLIEALVALIVLSVGMLGIAALYVESLRSNRTALLRTQAVMLASDMADRIRANRGGDANYEAAVDRDDTNAACESGGAGCTASELAQHDVAEWLGILEDSLPGGTGTIDFDNSTTPSSYTITVSWTETGVADLLTYRLRIQA